MFSLIITIISIALVAALALATLYYGGGAFNQGRAQAQAAKVRSQSQQLLGAAELFKANHGRYPVNVAEMVSDKYLSSVPMARAAVAQALADSAWLMPVPEQALFLLPMTAPEACRQVNQQSYGEPGILSGPLSGVQTQCYGPSPSQLYGMAAKDAQVLQAWVAADPEMVAVTAPALVAALPVSEASALWTVAPSAPLVADVSSSPEEAAPPDEPPPPAVGVLSASTLTVPFAPTNVGAHANGIAVLQNTGEGSLVISPATLAGSDAFTVVSDDCQGALAAGDSCAVEVRFSPAVTGPAGATLTLDSNGGTATVALSAEGILVPAGVLALTSTPAGFPGAVVGETSTQVVTVSNSGDAPLTFTTAPSIFGGVDKFTLASTCGTTVAPGASCTLTVTFAPTDTSPATAYLTFDTDVSTGTSLSLTGTASAPAP